jgi:tRNA (guanine37-N1)-methyltransferase
MVVRAEPVIKAVSKAIGRKKDALIIHLAPRSELFTNKVAFDIAHNKKIKDIVIICGRYEGIDSRVEEAFPGVKYSIGDFVLTGGEIAAMVIIDTITRQIDGVLSDGDSREEKREASGKYYTRPEILVFKKKKLKVPDVLLSGNHAEIQKWQKKHHKD